MQPLLPLEIRARIYVELDDIDLAEDISEVFWALCPDYFRNLTIGHVSLCEETMRVNRFIRLYPCSGNFVENLTIVTDYISQRAVDQFLKRFPSHRKLRELSLIYSFINPKHFKVENLRFARSLESVVTTSPDLTRLSFLGLQPSPALITACNDKLTRLDIGHIHIITDDSRFHLPSVLEILSFTPWAATLFSGSPPPTLRRIILSIDHHREMEYWNDCYAFLSKCTSLLSLCIENDSPVSPAVIRLLKTVGRHVEDICFKYAYRVGDKEKIKETIEKYQEIGSRFTFFSFIIRSSKITPYGIMMLRKFAIDFTLSFRLKSCFVQVEGAELIGGGEFKQDRYVIEAWERVLDC